MNILQQKDIVKSLNNEGYSLQLRQLRYWRSLNELPELYKDNNVYGYPEYIIDTIRDLCLKKGLYYLPKLCTILLEGELFEVYKIELFRVSNYYNNVIHTNKGIIVNKRKIW